MSYESYSVRGRTAEPARGLAATAAVAALVGGIPYLLCRFVGWPLPRHVPTWHAITSALGQRDISDTTVIDVLAIALWICWAVLVLAFVVEAIALARSRAVGRMPIAGRLQPLAGALLGTAVLTFASLVARPGGSGTGLPRVAITTPVRPPTTERGPLPIELTADITNAPITNGAATNGNVANGSGVHPTEMTYTVRDGDTLWGIAERQLGDAVEVECDLRAESWRAPAWRRNARTSALDLSGLGAPAPGHKGLTAGRLEAVTCVRNAPSTSQCADDPTNHRADDGPVERGRHRCARTVDDAGSHRTYGRDDRAHGGRPRASPRADGRQPCRG